MESSNGPYEDHCACQRGGFAGCHVRLGVGGPGGEGLGLVGDIEIDP